MTYRILIIDDYPTILSCLRFILEDCGYFVETMSSYTPFSFPHITPLPDLILLDYWMPGTNGSNACLQLKSSAETKNIPIILMSADNKINDLTQTILVNDVIIKPFDIDELLKKIQMHLAT